MFKFIVISFLLLNLSEVWGKTHSIIIKDFKFTPDHVMALKGDLIEFTNEDPEAHSVIPTLKSKVQFPGSGILNQNQTFFLEVESELTISAQCGAHPTMPGITIEVVPEKKRIIDEIRQKLNELESLP